ncbi:MAG TPA: metalloregulator ArsR/SmtB family transcription factor [Vicinamibacterales bacterium]|nr:metalloregulator ArsR/SmtB family transcription factor [Vicinamibacterales bacterium]
MPDAPSLLDSFSVLADPTRCRMLWLLDEQELTVSELCAVLQLPQSTGSRHLKTLSDADWVSSRRDGTSKYYALAVNGHATGSNGAGPRVATPATARGQIWALTRAQLADRPGVDQDRRRLARVLARRSETSQQFFATSAGQWDRLRAELFGEHFAMNALLGLMPASWTVADLGCGTGAMLAVLAPHVGRVIGVDASEEMLGAARRRLDGLTNVDLRHGSLESLPIEPASVDAATMMLVLHHMASPGAAIAEAARILRPGGTLLIVDMTPHDHEDYRQQMGHVWLGFSDEQVKRLLTQSGFAAPRLRALPADENAKGPGLFAATARKTD